MLRVAVLLVLCGVLAPTAVAGTVVKTALNPALKKTILVDARGRTLYLFTSESSTTIGCVDSCAVSWPPLLAVGKPTAGPGAKASLLGTAQRPDGKMQVTYHGHPLYRWAGGDGLGLGDRKPGDVDGQARFGVWWVLSPAGAAIKKQP
jgi:predicted lipoprotein with Yx(FWY)xxD motif